MQNELNQAIRSNVAELERIFRDAGYNETGDILKSISESPDQFFSLHRVLSRKLRRQRSDTTFSSRRTWFADYRSPDGRSLSHKQVEALVSVTKGWELPEDDIRILRICLTLWTGVPSVFCDGQAPDQNVIIRFYNDLQRMEKDDPVRRLVLLMNLSADVKRQQDKLGKEGQKRQRSRKAPSKISDDCNRDPVFLTSSLRCLTRSLWPGLEDDELARRRKSLSTSSLFGWKWLQLDYPEITLSLRHAAAMKYEKRKWKRIELHAINAYVESLPQFRIRDHMQRAWNSIVRHYYGDSDPPEELVRQVEVIPASLEGNIAGRHVRNARTAVTEIIPTSDRRNVQFELEQTSMERLQRLNQQADTSPEEEQAARVLSTIQTGSFLHLQSHSIPIAMSNTCPSRISSSWTYHRNESDLHDRRSDLSSVTSDRPVLPQHEFYQTDEAPHIEMNKHADGLTSTEGTQTQTTMTRNGQPVLPPYGSGDAWAADGVEGRTTAASFLTNEVLNLQYRSPGFWDGTDQVPTTASNYLPVTIPVCGEVDAWASCENEGSQSGHFNPQSWTQQTASFAAYGTSDAWATQPLASFWSSS